MDWDDLYASSDPNQAWETIKGHITKVLDSICPIRTFHIINYRPDWMTNELIEQIKGLFL